MILATAKIWSLSQINRYIQTEGGEKKEEVTFVDVTLWARLAEISGEYLKKGKPVFVEGRLQFDTWDDKQTGQKRSRLRVIAESMQLLGARDNGDRPADRTQGGRSGLCSCATDAPTRSGSRCHAR